MDMEKLLKDFEVAPKNPSEEALLRWREMVTITKNARPRFRMVADLVKRSEAERKRLSIQEKIRVALSVRKAALEFVDAGSAAGLGAEYKVSDEVQKEGFGINPEDLASTVSVEPYNFSSMDAQQGNAGNENCKPLLAAEIGVALDIEKAPFKFVDTGAAAGLGAEYEVSDCRRDGSKRKILEKIFAVANFIVELLSIVFDQLSSKHKYGFLPVCMGLSILAVLICLCELVCKIRKEKATWKREGVFYWFYDPSGDRFGSFADVIGLACACGQCIITTINYSLFLKHGNVPIRVSIWPSIFAFGQLCSKMWGEANRKQNVHKRESSSTDPTASV